MFVAVLILIVQVTALGHFVWSRPFPLLIAYPYVAVVNGLLGTPLTLTAEYGWRGYLLPRLVPLNYPGQVLWAALIKACSAPQLRRTRQAATTMT